MVVASYTTDLNTLAIGSITVDAGTWSESTDAGWDTGGSMVDDGNLYYNGTACVSAQLTKDASGTGAAGPASIMYEHTSTITVPTDGAVLIHHLWAAPPALNTIANGGVHIMIGNSPGIFFAWDISGSDFLPAPKGGWANYAINPGIGSPDDTVGSPATPYDTFGMAVSATAQARGNPNAVNAIRYGRCESIFTYGEVSDYCTFLGFGNTDATSTNKWSLIDPVEGGYKFQGLMSLGQAAILVDFRDSNVNISIANTINVTAGFNAIEVNNASSNIEWTAVNITALGIVSKGTFEMIDNATVSKTNCTFTDMNTFIYQSNATLTNTVYRRCNQITQGGATFDSCTFDNSPSAVTLLSDSLGDTSDCTFNNDASNHAVDLGIINPSSLYTEYPSSNKSTDTNLNSSLHKVGSSFEGNNEYLSSASFYIKKTANPTGNMTASLFAHTGAYGTSSEGTGTALTTSNTVDISTISSLFEMVTFTFPTAYLLSEEYYVIALEYNDGDSSNYCTVGLDSASPTYSGNYTYYTSVWGASSNIDAIFSIDTVPTISTSVTWNNYLNGYETYVAGGTSTGNEAILVNVPSGQTLTINVSAGHDTPSYYNTGTGSVVVANSVNLEVNGVFTGTEPTNYVRCRIEKTSDGTTIMNEEAQIAVGDGIYKATASYNYAADTAVTIRARYKGYLPFETTGTITSTGLKVTAVWVEDTIYT